MSLVFSRVNSAWIIVFGQSLVDLDGCRFWMDRDGAVEALARKGLVALASGEIV